MPDTYSSSVLGAEFAAELTMLKENGAVREDKEKSSGTILRFEKAEIMVHWAIAIPFLVCYVSAAVLALAFYNYPLHPLREVVSWIHRLSGVCLIVLPVMAMALGRKKMSAHTENIRQAWVWTWADLKWLAMMGLAAISSRFQLPEQGKFNAAEKMNFMMVMTTWPLYGITGALIWLPGIAFISWILHIAMALMATPLIFGHIYMAAFNPASRVGLPGMISGYVDREWAKHHYALWYREKFEKQGVVATLNCESCETNQPVHSWAEIIEETKETADACCPDCGAERGRFKVVLGDEEGLALEELLEEIEAAYS